MARRKNPYAVALGRKGGKKGGPARAANMTPEQRRESARNAVLTRWAKEKATPQPLIGAIFSEKPAENEATDEANFKKWAQEWKSARRATSSSTVLAMHPAYQRIIGMGKPALHLILLELQREVDHWFWALASIADENPVPPARRGKMKEMADAWLEWGRKKGYV